MNINDEGINTCFVPNCGNTDGIPFPEEPELIHRWLESLEIVGVNPEPGSFICGDHFDSGDFVQVTSEEGIVAHRLKEDALPKCFANEFLTFHARDNSSDHPELHYTISDPERENESLNSNEDSSHAPAFQEDPSLGSLLQNENSLEDNVTDKCLNPGSLPTLDDDNLEETNHDASFPSVTDENSSQDLVPSYETTEGTVFNDDPYTTSEHFEAQEEGDSLNDVERTAQEMEGMVALDENEEQSLLMEHSEIKEASDVSQIENSIIEGEENESLGEMYANENEIGEEENAGNIADDIPQIQEEEEESTENEPANAIDYVHEENGDESMLSENQIEENEIQDTINVENTVENVEMEENLEHELSESLEHELSGNTCRLCLSVIEVNKSIGEDLQENVLISEAINSCVHPLKVRLGDQLSQTICKQCFDSLQAFYLFRRTCLDNDRSERIRRNVDLQSPTPLNGKRKASESENVYLAKKSASEEQYDSNDLLKILTEDSNDEMETKKPKTVFRIQSKPNVSEKSTAVIKTKMSPFTKQRQIIVKQAKTNRSYNNIQAEMRRIIAGSKELAEVDHVVVKVLSDDDEEKSSNIEVAKPKRMKVIRVGDHTNVITLEGTSLNKANVPKTLRTYADSSFKSRVGTFPCMKKFGAYNTEFALIDGYLYEYRLRKGRERQLRCLLSVCKGHATQKMLPNSNTFENKATVKVAHNHRPISEHEMKKHMFYYVMKWKMQSDKSLNFRAVYDSVCDKEPNLRQLVPLRNVINEICHHQLVYKVPKIESFDEFYEKIEQDEFLKLQFTNNGKQFYQERFCIKSEGTKAVVFGNRDMIKKYSYSKLLYVDASFRINSSEQFSYQLVTALVWVEESYFPILYALVNQKSLEIFKKIFGFLRDDLAPNLVPDEVVTEYESNIYYALGETYVDSHIGGSMFYYVQNLYKKICSLHLTRELETNPTFRNTYNMLIMLPLLPVNTMMDALYSVETQTQHSGFTTEMLSLFDHVKTNWMGHVTPDLFCVHRLETRINENVVAPFKKLRDFLTLMKGKVVKDGLTIVNVCEKLIELEVFLRSTYASENKRSFCREVSTCQKKNVIRAWQYIETHPKININSFFSKVLGYIKTLESQLWIWGYYKYTGANDEELINSSNFSIVNEDLEVEMNADDDGEDVEGEMGEEDGDTQYIYTEEDVGEGEEAVVMEAVVGPSGEFVFTDRNAAAQSTKEQVIGEESYYVYRC